MAGYPYDCPDQSHDNLELLKASLHLKEVLYFKLSPLRLHSPFRLGNFSAWWFTDQWPQRLGSRRMRWRGMLHRDSLLEGLPKRKFLGEIFFAYARAHTLSSYKITTCLPTGCFSPVLDQHALILNYDQWGMGFPKSWAPQHAPAVLCCFLWWTGMKVGAAKNSYGRPGLGMVTGA